MEDNKKLELTDEELEQVAGGLEEVLDTSCWHTQQCSKGHTYWLWLEACPHCLANANTSVETNTSQLTTAQQNTGGNTSSNTSSSTSSNTSGVYSELLRPIDVQR